MLNVLPPSTVGPAAGAPANTTEGDRKVVYWHRDLPPLDSESLGEHTVEADSMRVAGTERFICSAIFSNSMPCRWRRTSTSR